jgi:ABC-type multidrug transport system fused ATPase/permease subunit
MSKIKEIFPKITEKQNTGFGLVTILVCCVLAYWQKERSLIVTAIILCLITMMIPVVFYPFASLWFGLSQVLNKFTSIVLLSLVFFLVVTPIGLIRQLLGKDSLRLKQFKKGSQSVMTNRQHEYTAKDMEETF